MKIQRWMSSNAKKRANENVNAVERSEGPLKPPSTVLLANPHPRLSLLRKINNEQRLVNRIPMLLS
jgi:hypothetical protein